MGASLRGRSVHSSTGTTVPPKCAHLCGSKQPSRRIVQPCNRIAVRGCGHLGGGGGENPRRAREIGGYLVRDRGSSFRPRGAARASRFSEKARRAAARWSSWGFSPVTWANSRRSRKRPVLVWASSAASTTDPQWPACESCSADEVFTSTLRAGGLRPTCRCVRTRPGGRAPLPLGMRRHAGRERKQPVQHGALCRVCFTADQARFATAAVPVPRAGS